MSGEARAVAALDAPFTASLLVEDLARLGVELGDVLLVHSSMKEIGWTAGGTQAIVEALLTAVGESGTIVMPAQSTQLSDPALWEAPAVPESWWETIRDETPAFDPELTPTRGMGQIVDCLRSHAGAERSGHPLYSFAAVGALALHLLVPHELTEGFTDQSPLGRMYEAGAKVLFLGTGHANNTSFHLAEYRATWDSKTSRLTSAPVLVDGNRVWATWTELAIDEDDFSEIGHAFQESAINSSGYVVGSVGSASSTLMSQRALVDFAVGWINNNR